MTWKKKRERRRRREWNSGWQWIKVHFFFAFSFFSFFHSNAFSPMATRSPSHYLVAEADTDFAPDQIRENAPLQSYLRERLLEVRTRNYSNTGIADAKAIEKISSEFEILVFGPARVGKSTLIQELSGDEEIKTSAGLNSCTQTTTAYTDQYGVRWWDTRGKIRSLQHRMRCFVLLSAESWSMRSLESSGIETWTENEASQFLKEKFLDRHIVPRAAIFCRTAGALANTPVLLSIFNQLKSHGVTLFYVITRWPFIPRREQIAIVDEAIELLGGAAKGIYPSEKKRINDNASQVPVVTLGSGRIFFAFDSM